MKKTILLFLLLVVTSALVSSCGKQAEEAPPMDRLVLKSGGVIQGAIVSETESEVKFEWGGGVVGFGRDEIERIERDVSNQPLTEGGSDLIVPDFAPEGGLQHKDWPEGVKHVVYLKNGENVGGEIKVVNDKMITVRQALEGGGAIEHDLDPAQVEKIALWPPPPDSGRERLAEFLTQYPTLDLLRRGYYYIMSSEQNQSDLKRFLRTIDHFHHDFLFHFFGLFDPNQPLPNLDVMIFGTRTEFDALLQEIGFNVRSNPVGFYHFNERKLVFYNVKTDAAVQAGLAQTRQAQDQIASVRSSYSPREQSQIDMMETQAQRQELQLLGDVLLRNINVIRHEGGHQLFHTLGVTPLEVYAGGWLIEGMAVYCETDPIGRIHEEKLMLLRYELEKGEPMPLEYLINFARGKGFHKLDPIYANVAYANSWAFIYFLMKDYREPFFNFLKEMRVQGPAYNEYLERDLLEKHLGKGIKAVDEEYHKFTKHLVRNYIDEAAYEEFSYQLMRQE
jgi:hypothetical protein